MWGIKSAVSYSTIYRYIKQTDNSSYAAIYLNTCTRIQTTCLMYFGLFFSISRVLKLLSRVRLGKLVEMICLHRQNVVAWLTLSIISYVKNVVAWLNSQTVKSIRQIIVAALKCQMFLFDNVNTLLLRRYVNCFIFLKSKRGCLVIKSNYSFF